VKISRNVSTSVRLLVLVSVLMLLSVSVLLSVLEGLIYPRALLKQLCALY